MTRRDLSERTPLSPAANSSSPKYSSLNRNKVTPPITCATCCSTHRLARHFSEFALGAVIIYCLYLLQAEVDYSYDYYVFAQQWPAALCKEINSTHHGTCTNVPNDVNTWVVHGLWPSKSHVKHHGPFNCNSSWGYDHNLMERISDDMKRDWPNLMQNTEEDSFWTHEWTKHGTCYCQNDTCSSLVDYFVKALEQRDAVNFDTKLTSAGISPSTTEMYELEAITSVLGDGDYQCYKTEHDGKFQVLAQIYICLDRQFNRVNCKDYRVTPPGIEYFKTETDAPFSSGPYTPTPCSEKLPVKIYPVHMPML